MARSFYSTGRRGVAYGGASSSARSAESIRGAEDFLKLSKALKAAGQTELRKELNKVVAAAAKPVIPAIRAAAEANLPKHGGLNQRIAKKPLRVQTRTGAKTAGVRIVGSSVEPRINAGLVWHPVFGRKGKAKNNGRNSVVQNVPRAAGYFSETIAGQAPELRDAIAEAMDEFTDKIVREVR